jgi:hypothetical protein
MSTETNITTTTNKDAIINKTITEIIDYLRCPISHQLFFDPVTANDGQSYENESLQAWIKQSSNTLKSPMTSQNLSTTIYKNNVLKQIINIVTTNMPEYLEEQYKDFTQFRYAKNKLNIIKIISAQDEKEYPQLLKYIEYDLQDLIKSLPIAINFIELPLDIIKYIINNNTNKTTSDILYGSLLKYGQNTEINKLFYDKRLTSSLQIDKYYLINKKEVMDALSTGNDTELLLNFINYRISDFCTTENGNYTFQCKYSFDSSLKRYKNIMEIVKCSTNVINHIINNCGLSLPKYSPSSTSSLATIEKPLTMETFVINIIYECIETKNDEKLATLIKQLSPVILRLAWLPDLLVREEMFLAYGQCILKYGTFFNCYSTKLNNTSIIEYMCTNDLTEQLLYLYKNNKSIYSRFGHEEATVEEFLIKNCTHKTLISIVPCCCAMSLKLMYDHYESNEITEEDALFIANTINSLDKVYAGQVTILSKLIKRYPSIMDIKFRNVIFAELFFHGISIFDSEFAKNPDILRRIFASSKFTIDHYELLKNNESIYLLHCYEDKYLIIYYFDASKPNKKLTEITNKFTELLISKIDAVSKEVLQNTLPVFLTLGSDVDLLKNLISHCSPIKDDDFKFSLFETIQKNILLNQRSKYEIFKLLN